MNLNSVLASFIAQINQAINVKKTNFLNCKGNKICELVLRKLKQMSMVEKYSKSGFEKGLMIFNVHFTSLRSGFTLMRGIKMKSKPGCRIYTDVKNIDRNKSNMFHKAIISTNKGVLTCFECKKHNVGGEVIAIVR